MLQDDLVTVRKSDLEKLTTEVMQLKEFLPRVLSGDLIHRARTALTGMCLLNIVSCSKCGGGYVLLCSRSSRLTQLSLLTFDHVRVVKEQLVQEQKQLRQECLHLQSRLEAMQTECQKEREVREGRSGSRGLYDALVFLLTSTSSLVEFITTRHLVEQLCVCVGEAAATWAAVAERSRAAAAGRLLLRSWVCSLQSAVELLGQRRCGDAVAGWCESARPSPCVRVILTPVTTRGNCHLNAVRVCAEETPVFSWCNCSNSGELCRVSGWRGENWGSQLPGAPVCFGSGWNNHKWVHTLIW